MDREDIVLIVFFTVFFLVVIVSKCSAGELTFSPVSATYHPAYHNRQDRKELVRNIGTTTFHPQVSLIYKKQWWQGNAFYMINSFGDHAGGFTIGPRLELIDDVLDVGAVGGLMMREHLYGIHPDPLIASFGGSQVGGLQKGGVDVLMIFFGTVGLTAPHLDPAPSIDCGVSPVLTNCSLGVEVTW